jgi:hypothetical protein
MPINDVEKRREYHRKYHREWYKKNKEKRIRFNKAWQNEQKRLYEEYKSTLKCSVCGEDETVCLDFHHRDPNEKEFTIGMVRKNMSFENVKKEIDKCDVLCANCHRKVHAGLIDLPG